MIDINTVDDVYEVTFKNTQRLDVFLSETVKTKLLQLFEQPGTKILINMDGIHFLNSSGFAAFLALSKEARNTGGRIIFCNVHESALKLFKVLQLHQSFTIIDNRDEALRSFK
ncbi:MAG: STAS domain-containing protein [Bacteroidales bacterium]|jgi:anti-sigma B factor antagonist|nr:STAS domain-containing protein [Bacteroidales bacterium]